MKQWFLLAGAITTEVAATLSLKAALNHPSWYIVVAAGYIGAFVFLTFCLREGMQIGVAYGRQGASQRHARGIRNRLEHSNMDDIFQHGVHEFIQEFIADNSRLGEIITKQYLI